MIDKDVLQEVLAVALNNGVNLRIFLWSTAERVRFFAKTTDRARQYGPRRGRGNPGDSGESTAYAYTK